MEDKQKRRTQKVKMKTNNRMNVIEWMCALSIVAKASGRLLKQIDALEICRLRYQMKNEMIYAFFCHQLKN